MNTMTKLGVAGLVVAAAMGASGRSDAQVCELCTGELEVQIGFDAEATTTYSTAIGTWSKADGWQASAVGYYARALDKNATAVGHVAWARSIGSTAIGNATDASGDFSTALALGTEAHAYASTAIGSCNDDIGGSPDTWNATDPLFVIGNGRYDSSQHICETRSTSLVILKNGNVGIGENAPEAPLQVRGGADATGSGGGYIVIGSSGGKTVRLDNNEIQALNNGNVSQLHLNDNGGGVRIGSPSQSSSLQVHGDILVGGDIYHFSDARLKRDIVSLDYGLDAVTHLRPVSYLWKDRDNDQRSVGLIAQEPQQVIPELVHVQDDEEGTLTVDYNGVTIVLLGAVQDLEAQVRENGVLRETVRVQAEKLSSLTEENDGQADRLSRQENELAELRASMQAQADEIAELRASVEALTTALK